MKAAALKRAGKTLELKDFSAGDFVHHRTWTVPPSGPQQPVVAKRPMRIMSINGEIITCGGDREFEACELIKSDWKPR